MNVNVSTFPTQFEIPSENVGVTLNVSTIGEVVVLATLYELIVPFPIPSANPAVITSFVQSYVVVPPVFNVANVTVAIDSSWQYVADGIGCTCPSGFTVILNVWVGPEHFRLLKVFSGVTTKVDTTGLFPAFLPVNASISP